MNARKDLGSMDWAGRVRASARSPRNVGFTLIELLIVISILGLLAAVLLPNIFSVTQAAKDTETEATMLRLSTGCGTFERKHSYYPPDDLKWPDAEKKTTWKPDNGQNTGIESLVCFLSQSQADGEDLNDLAKHFTNTDNDDHGVDLPRLQRKDRIELADAWKTPLVYFGKFGMGKQQTVAIGEGETQTVTAKKRADGRPYGDGKFQILSAGRDMIFGTDDDLVWPKN